MTETAIQYVVRTEQGGWRIASSRVSLDSVILAWLAGRSPEAIVDSFPTLSLEQVHGAVAFYLHHQVEIDRYLSEQNERWEELRSASASDSSPLMRRIRASHVAIASRG